MMNKVGVYVLILILLPSYSFVVPTDVQDTESWFLLGLNYPWLNYGHDFGVTNWGHNGVSSEQSQQQIDKDFADMRANGVHVVRWFIFADGRASPEFDEEGLVTGFDERFYIDLDMALSIAQKHEIYLMPVLFDFHLADTAKIDNGTLLGGRANLITDLIIRQSFFDYALVPLLQRYGQNQQIIAWDVINEPEGAMQITGGNWVGEAVGSDAMQSFVSEVVTFIHDYAFQPVTLGSASRVWLGLWKDSQLDFYQYHYYDHMENDAPFEYLAADLKLDKPIIVGEFPSKGSQRSLTKFFDTILQNGYVGALAWSYRGGDDFSDFESNSEDFAVWSQAHDSLVNNDVMATFFCSAGEAPSNCLK